MTSNIPRTRYLEVLDSYRSDAALIKVVAGIRGCGKSVLLRQFREHLIKDGVPEPDIVFVDLERMRGTVRTGEDLRNMLAERIRCRGCYILLDSIHPVRRWQEAVVEISSKHSANIYVTESETGIAPDHPSIRDAGGFARILMLPFSFREFLARYPSEPEGYRDRLDQYLEWGGMPIIDLNDDPAKNRTILRGIYDSVVNTAIRSKTELDQSIVDDITGYLMANPRSLHSAGSVSKGIRVVEPRTTRKYIHELCGSLVFHWAGRFELDGSKHVRLNGRLYPADPGLMHSILYGTDENGTSGLECVVYLELLRRGYEVSVGTYGKRQIDFVAMKGKTPNEFVQVVPGACGKDALDRVAELSPVLWPGTRLTVITLDDTGSETPEGVRVMGAVEWLLDGCRVSHGPPPYPARICGNSLRDSGPDISGDAPPHGSTRSKARTPCGIPHSGATPTIGRV